MDEFGVEDEPIRVLPLTTAHYLKKEKTGFSLCHQTIVPLLSLSMPLRILANAEGECRELELDDVTLMFFDTLMASLNSAFPGKRTNFDFFEYADEDGDSLSVRTDEELETFLGEMSISNNGIPLEIRLRSSHSLMRQQISFDESDEFILGHFPSNSQQNETEIQNGMEMNWKISPEDLQLVERLSDGQFGTVYKALDVKQDRLMAVKCIGIDNSSGTRQGLLNEIAILRKCTHPNIVAFYAALFVENQLLICMELMDALSLDLYGAIPSPVLGAVSVAIVDGLVHLWGRSIIHRDIKPSNFLVNSNGQVKLADFGVSKQMAQSIAWSYVGTKVYMAPERIGGGIYNVASDVWSLGLSLAEMALGRFPFKSANDPKIPLMDSFCFSPENIALLLNDPTLISMPNEFNELVAGCIQLNPKNRFGIEQIYSSQFLQSNRPMNQQIVANFIQKKKME